MVKFIVGLALGLCLSGVQNQEKLAYSAKAAAHQYGPGASVGASFRCATPEKALKLVKQLETLGDDARPDWDTLK